MEGDRKRKVKSTEADECENPLTEQYLLCIFSFYCMWTVNYLLVNTLTCVSLGLLTACRLCYFLRSELAKVATPS